MKLRTRLLLSIGLTMACLFIGTWQLTNGLMMRSFASLEKTDAERNIERVRQTVEQMSAELNVKNADWARWDDTYQFMSDRNKDYLESNITENAVTTLKMDIMLFIDEERREVISRAVKRHELPAPNGKLLTKELYEILGTPAGKKGLDGLVLLEERPILVSALPVHKSDGTGDARGWLVFGSYIDEDRVQQLRRMTRLDAQAHPATAHPPHGTSSSEGSQTKEFETHIVPVSSQQLAGYTYMKDLYGRPALLLRVKMPREIYMQGESTVRLIAEMLLIVAVIFAAVVILVLEKFALARVVGLTNQVKKIGAGTGPDRVKLTGRDELALLATRINEMLTTLEQEREQVVERQNEINAKNAVLESAIEGIAQLDSRGRYVMVNSAYAQMIGCNAEELIGESCMVDVLAEDHGRLLTALRQTHENGRAEMLVRGLKRDGGIFYEEATLITSYDYDGLESGHHLFVKDVTERRQLEIEIEHRAFHDKLTDLPNRALFMDRIVLAFAKAQRHRMGTAVLFIDLDNFKLVNDSLGHDAGDALLVEVANRLQDSVRPGDTVARLGGDEFTILLEDLATSDEAEEIAQRVLDSLRAPILLGQTEAFASATVGIAFADDPELTPEGLMKNADTTMYHAKAKGKSCYAIYDSSMQDWATERMDLETALRKAQPNGELHVHYQPLIDLETGAIVGSEALARWNHPTRGNVSPGQFIPIAEETGLIISIGYFIMEEACRQTVIWQKEFRKENLTVSVNLSGRQLQQGDVIDRVADVLARTGLAPECLKLEITESVLMDRNDCVGKLRQLRELGVKLALDDFGTGFSSLSRLSAFPIDTIKIDRAFISRLDEEEQARAVVQAIMVLSHSMNMNVTGEGVETDTQLKIIKSLGCETGQGYLFARPMDPAGFAATLEKALGSRAA